MIVAALVAAALGGGYWWGTKRAAATTAMADGMGAKGERKILYYRNPMGLPDTSPTQKKDPMGMDYIAVYEGEPNDEPASVNQVIISTEKVQKLGVKTEVARMRSLTRAVRAAGRIDPDERRTYAISPKFEGYVERLLVNATGQPVSKGQPLFEVYSPELVSAQREYAIAAKGVESLTEAGGEAQASMRRLAESSLIRLKNWDISEEQINVLAKSGQTRRTLTFRSPVAGIVTEKKAVQGMRFMPGEALYQITDLSRVWVIADLFEQDIALVTSGAKAKIKINAYPDKLFEGNVTYVYPTLKLETRTVPVRIELSNPGALLKPGMFAQVELGVAASGAVVTVPVTAVIDSGTRQIVLVQAREGRYEPREVKLGARSDDYVEVLNGVKDGEAVVIAANFLIDAESNLKAAIGGFGHAAHSDGKTASDAGNVKPEPMGAGHRAEGTVEALDAKAGTVSIRHGPVESLKWPAMTMEFKLANAALQEGLKAGAKVGFEFVERQPGEWVITAVKPVASAKESGAPVAAVTPHAAH
ncbi:MAG: efflux RND transporter periplasmic adaptor subunit [Betaproteobacteria bacterium]|nr:efflux RND transporter periplasmic adaptor subunit [Betaproteobacteria bacterium]